MYFLDSSSFGIFCLLVSEKLLMRLYILYQVAVFSTRYRLLPYLPIHTIKETALHDPPKLAYP